MKLTPNKLTDMNSTEVSSVEAALKKGEREKALETLVTCSYVIIVMNDDSGRLMFVYW